METIEFDKKGVTVEGLNTYTIITDHSVEIYDYEGNEIAYLDNNIQLKKEE